MNTPLPCLSPATSARLRAAWALVAVLLTTLSLGIPHANSAIPKEVTTKKLFGKWTDTTLEGYYLGSDPGGSDVSPKWIAIGAPLSDEREGVSDEGAVQVFNAVTGGWVRKILPPVGTGVDAYFGAALAISGDLLAVGARQAATNRGLVFVYNLSTGALVKTLSANDGVPFDYLGYKVAFAGNTVVASSFTNSSAKGAVYVFNVLTGLQTAKLTASDGVAGDLLGYGLTMEGNLVVAGAPGDDAARGSVYLFDISNPAVPLEVRKYQPATSVAGDGVGGHLAMHQGKLIIGCRFVGKCFYYETQRGEEGTLTVGGSGASFGQAVAIHGPLIALGEREANGNKGAVHLFKASDRSYIRTLIAPNGDTSAQRYGCTVALSGNSLLVTAPDESTQATNSGAAYLISPVMEALPYTRVAAKGDFVQGPPTIPNKPGPVDLNYNVIGDAFINPGYEPYFTSSLTGAGSNKGKDVGAFSAVVDPSRVDLVFKTRDLFTETPNPISYGAPSRLSMNDYDLTIGFSTVTGTGVNATNNQLLWYRTNTTRGTVIRTGTPFIDSTLVGTSPTGIQEAVTSFAGATKQLTTVCTLKVGVSGTTAMNDSALYASRVAISAEAVREGSASPVPLPAGSFLGQFAPRVASVYIAQVYSTALTGNLITTANNTAIYAKPYGFTPLVVAQKGDTAVDGTGANLTGATYSAFIGEGANATNGALYRATLAGAAPAVTAATNEGLWMLRGDGVRRLAFRKGQTLAGAGGAKIAKIIQYWYSGLNDSNCEVVALVQLSGPGVTAANDQALVLFDHTFTHYVLLREGDFAPGCGNARIGVISRVDANAWYRSLAIAVTLTGATPTTDQALYTASLWTGNTTNQAILRRPFLRLRKGQLFENQPGKVKSISLPASVITPSGAGATGRGNCISWSGLFAFVVEFDNGVRQVVKGNVH